MEPTLRQLEYLVNLSQTLHFRRAAERCHVTQPALSVQIQQLERSLGVQLFEREGRKVRLTPAGRTAVDRARTVLRAVGTLIADTTAHADELTGILAIGAIPTIAPYLFPHLVPIIMRSHRGIRPRLLEERTADLVKQLDAGTIDVALVALESELGDLETVAIARDPFWLVTPPQHRLAKRRRLRECDLEGERILLLEDGHCFRDQARSLCRRSGVSEEVDFAASSMGTLIEMVAAGVGATLIPAVALSTLADRPLATIPFQKRGPARTIALAWRGSAPDAPRYRALADVIRGHLPEVLAGRPIGNSE